MIVLIGLFVGIRDLAARGRHLRGEHRDDPVRATDGAPAAAGRGRLERLLVRLARRRRALGADRGLPRPAAEVPGFVYAITIVQFVLFFSFAVNMALQYAQVGRWRDYLHGEVVYIALSLTAKSLLAWLIFANVLRT